MYFGESCAILQLSQRMNLNFSFSHGDFIVIQINYEEMFRQ